MKIHAVERLLADPMPTRSLLRERLFVPLLLKNRKGSFLVEIFKEKEIGPM